MIMQAAASKKPELHDWLVQYTVVHHAELQAVVVRCATRSEVPETFKQWCDEHFESGFVLDHILKIIELGDIPF